MIVKLTVNIADDVADALRRFATSEGLSITDAVCFLLSAGVFCYDEQLRGRIILTAKSNGSDKQVLEMFSPDQMRQFRTQAAVSR